MSEQGELKDDVRGVKALVRETKMESRQHANVRQILHHTLFICTSDGRIVGASSSGAVDSGLIPNGIKPMTLKLEFTASVLEAQH